MKVSLADLGRERRPLNPAFLKAGCWSSQRFELLPLSKSSPLQRPPLELSVNAAVYLFRDLEIPLWYSNICVVCIVFQGRCGV